MGYKIKTDHSKMEKAAEVIETYVGNMDTKMSNADRAVLMMQSNWKGVDAGALKGKWDTVKDKDSTYGRMKTSLENYANYLKNAADKYKAAQIDAINRANKLPKW